MKDRIFLNQFAASSVLSTALQDSRTILTEPEKDGKEATGLQAWLQLFRK